MKKHKETNTDEVKPIKNYDKIVENYHTTQGNKKLINYFLQVLKSDHFNIEVSIIKQNYKIPTEGFCRRQVVFGKLAEDICYKYNEETGGADIIINGMETRPKEWTNCTSIEQQIKFHNDIIKLCKTYSLHYVDWHEVIELYIFFNILEIPKHINSYNLCLLIDLTEDKKEVKREKAEGIYRYKGSVEESDDFAFPIAIRISPYASMRDIIDYIKKIYKTSIKPAQKKYHNKNIKIGKIKTKDKSKQERNNFIYNNREKSLKTINKLLRENNFEILDEGHIGKIISLEKKKRKEV